MKQCFAVKERHPVLPDRVVQVTDSAVQAEFVCEVLNGESVKLTDPNPQYYVGITRMN